MKDGCRGMWDVSVVSKSDYYAFLQDIEMHLGSPDEVVKKYAFLGKETAKALGKHFLTRIFLERDKRFWEEGDPNAIYTEVLEAMKISIDDGVLCRKAHAMGLSPFLLMSGIVKMHVERRCLEPKEVENIVKRIVFRQPGFILNITEGFQAFADNIRRCIREDITALSPIEKNKNLEKGCKGEWALSKGLEERNIPYFTEAMLLQAGVQKTPDFLLQVPCTIGSHIVNWIESKFMFGDKKVFAQIKNNQLEPYKNRFGNGVVIFWRGFIEGLYPPDGVLVLERFPIDIRSMGE
eukprot:GHVN01021091.1.p1 GENE.GHVN01021091.1~~GHVN01021091.1.p1  ORF type:complete len:293 (+),score=18.28 GHVN01021091.1:112-990(+)